MFYIKYTTMKSKLLIAAIFSFFCIALQAQDDTAITDEELERYAIMMDSIEEMKADLMAEITEMVKNNDSISVSRYNDLFRIIDDEAKLQEANATAQEINAVRKVQERKDAGTAEINEAFQSMAKEYVGASSYNKIKKALNADTELKAKYQGMLDKLKEDNQEQG